MTAAFLFYAAPAILIGLLGVSPSFTAWRYATMTTIAKKNGRSFAQGRLENIHYCSVVVIALLPALNIVALIEMLVFFAKDALKKKS